MKKKRLDDILIEKKLTEDRKSAFIVVTEGRVFINGQKAISPATPVEPAARIKIKAAPKYVGRGAYKLEGALKQFNIDVGGKICLDVGAATGGFTQVLLKNGATKVYAVDTARGKLELNLRENPRVVVMEGTDIRKVKSLPKPVALTVIDVSLVSLRHILHAIKNVPLLDQDARVITLLKPQYETRDPGHLKKGIIVDKTIREQIKIEFENWLTDQAWSILDWMKSPIKGTEGNTEYLYLLKSS